MCHVSIVLPRNLMWFHFHNNEEEHLFSVNLKESGKEILKFWKIEIAYVEIRTRKDLITSQALYQLSYGSLRDFQAKYI